MLFATEAALVSQDTGIAFATPTTDVSAVSSTESPGPAEAQDEASAVLMARLQGRKIEVLSQRAADSTTYALPSGELETAAYAGPIRVKRAGVWKGIDTALSDTGADLTPAAAVADIAVSDGGDTDLASVTKGKESFGLGWQDKLPTPTVKNSTASYDLGSGQTLSVTALAQGFSENIKLAQQPDGAAVSYRIPLDLDGLKLSQAGSGHLLLKNSAGDLVAEAPAPMMWDASKDPASGESAHQKQVTTAVETADDGAQTLVLTPDHDFLASATYPVTVDPTSTLAVTTDTWVQTPDYTDSQVSSTELKSGTYDSGSDIARSYLKFDVSKFAGKHITDTNLALYSYYSSTCSTSGAGTQVRRITSSWSSSDVTWAVQPSTTTTGAVTSTVAKGYSSTDCPGGTVNFDIDAIVQAWASGSANYGLQVRGADESDSLTWRRFRSANYISGDNSVEPHLTVTYNSYATTSALAISPSSVNAYSGKRYITTYTPTLSAKVTDADGSSVKAQFEITNDPAYSGETAYSFTGTSSSVASGGTAKLTIPAASAVAASHLRFRVRGYDGTDYGSWSGYTTFVPNVAKPGAPTVLCDSYPVSTWTARADGAVTCTLDTSSGDGAGYYWGLDDSLTPTHLYDTVDGNGGDPLTVSISPADGWHKLYAKTVDSGGNISTATTTYEFGVGADGAALLTPAEGDTAARRVSLSSTGKPSYTGVIYQYRRGETDTTWHDVPVGDIKSSKGSTISAWPVAVVSGTPATLVWNITSSLSQDGPIDIRAAFTDGTTTGYSQTRTITVDREAGTAPSDTVGPGSVNDLTGDYTISATDVSVFDLSVSRTVSSRHPSAGADAEGQVAIFGPQWTAGISDELTQSNWSYIRKSSATSVALVDGSGEQTGFTKTTAGGWSPEPGAEDLTLTGSVDAAFTLKDNDGTVSTFAKVSSSATTWQLTATRLTTENSTTTVVPEAVPSGTSTLARPKFVIAPTTAVSAASCQTAIETAVAAGNDWFTNTSTTAGCRVLQFVYATSTTATGSSLGDYSGRVQQIKVWATSPGDTKTTATPIARYSYDTGGRLSQEWDARISTPLKTTYAYDSAGRIITLTPPGELPWTLVYGKAGNAATAGDGMLLSASRPNLAAGSKSTLDGTTARTTVVYDVPLSDTKAPNAMGPDNVDDWGQTDVPTDATAVFPAAVSASDVTPASSTGSDLSASDYTRATISYADASGREVNVATPGGYIATSEYDQFGNSTRQLTPGNRELALATDTASPLYDELTALEIVGMPTADRAQLLSSTSAYTHDGLRETDAYGPLHQVTLTSPLKAGSGGSDLPAGTRIPARQHTTTSYDEGRPTDGTATVANQPTTVRTGAFVDGYPSDADVRTTTTTYDWVKGLPTKTASADKPTLASTTTYDSQGRIVQTTLPKSNGTDANTTVTAYYSATGTGACHGRPEWADLICTTGPAGAITGANSNPTQLPVRTVEYDRWGNTAKVTETVSGVTRTTTTSTDAAGRGIRTSVSGGVGTAVPDAVTTYDADTGEIASVASDGKTITHTYDALDREISYNDGTGNTTTAAYDALSRLVKSTDSAQSATTYAYDTAKEPRGLTTSRTDSVAGTFAATYNADGGLTTESLPGGYTLNVTRNEVGAQTSRVYTRDSDSTIVASDTVDRSVHGETAADTDSNGQTRSRSYGYDPLGRLIRADETNPDGSCTRRDYSLDDNSNRTALATSTGDAGAECTSTGAVTTAYTYDSADRLTNSGTVYDAFGRTTTQSSGATIAYYADDMVRQQTAGNSRQTWTLDAVGRLAAWTTQDKNSDGTWTQTGSRTNHYAADGDGPSWTAEDANGTITRNVQGLDNALEATTGKTGATALQLTDIHGDITVQLPLATTGAPTALAYDEYGNLQGESPSTRYGWLGTTQRASDTPTGAFLMGIRLYDPATGRFLSVDAMEGGGANAYAYCSADPVNCTDPTGLFDYEITYDIGWSKVSAKRFFTFVKANFGAVFPIAGHPNKLPGVGTRINLHVGPAPFPVRVSAMNSHYWKFDTLKGHPDYPGWISFNFKRKKNGHMLMIVHGHSRFSLADIFVGGSTYEKIATDMWAKFWRNLQNLEAQINHYY